MNRALQLGDFSNPLGVVGDVQEAIAELRQTIHDLRPRIEVALDAVPQINANADRITTYMPWLIGALGFLGAAIVAHGVLTRTRRR